MANTHNYSLENGQSSDRTVLTRRLSFKECQHTIHKDRRIFVPKGGAPAIVTGPFKYDWQDIVE